jgi:hypothetical protein
VLVLLHTLVGVLELLHVLVTVTTFVTVTVQVPLWSWGGLGHDLLLLWLLLQVVVVV